MSEKNISLVEILKNSLNSADLYSQFNSSKLWIKDSELLKKTMSWLGFHAESYFSPLRGCFLFELDSMQSLDYFSPLHARDGVLTLLQFFFKNPKPLTSKTLLLVHERLENLIPDQWQSNCLVYKKSPKNPPFKTTAKKRLIIMNSALGANHCSASFARTAIENFKELAGEIESFTLVNFMSKNNLEKDALETLSKEQLEVFVQLTNQFGDKVEILTPQELYAEDLSNSKYFDLNEFNYFYSDSAFEDLVLCRGAKPLYSNQRTDMMYRLDLSFYHEIQVFPAYPKATTRVLEVLKSFNSTPSLFHKERNHKPTIIDSSVRLTSVEFEMFAYEFASEEIRPMSDFK